MLHYVCIINFRTIIIIINFPHDVMWYTKIAAHQLSNIPYTRV